MSIQIEWEDYSYTKLAQMAEMQLKNARNSGAADEEVEELLNNFMNLSEKAAKENA